MTMLVPQRDNHGAVHFDPQTVGRLREAVVVLRKVNIKKLSKRETPSASTAWELIGMGQVQLHLHEKDLPWYEEGLIVNDQPRDEKVARDIAKATIGFAIARSDTGEVMKTYGADGLKQAVLDARSVRLSFTPVVTQVAPEPDDDDEAAIRAFLGSHEEGEAPTPQES